MCFRRKQKHPVQQVAKLNVPDASEGNPKGMPCPDFITGWGILHGKTLSITNKFLERKRKRKWHFLQQQ